MEIIQKFVKIFPETTLGLGAFLGFPRAGSHTELPRGAARRVKTSDIYGAVRARGALRSLNLRVFGVRGGWSRNWWRRGRVAATGRATGGWCKVGAPRRLGRVAARCKEGGRVDGAARRSTVVGEGGRCGRRGAAWVV